MISVEKIAQMEPEQLKYYAENANEIFDEYDTAHELRNKCLNELRFKIQEHLYINFVHKLAWTL